MKRDQYYCGEAAVVELPRLLPLIQTLPEEINNRIRHPSLKTKPYVPSLAVAVHLLDRMCVERL